MRVLLYAKMLKETKTEETIVFFVKFLSLVAFQVGGGPGPPGPPSGYAYECWHCDWGSPSPPGYAYDNTKPVTLKRCKNQCFLNVFEPNYCLKSVKLLDNLAFVF